MLLYSLYSYCSGDFNPYRARLECGSSCVRAQTGVRSDQRQQIWYLLFHANHVTLRRKSKN